MLPLIAEPTKNLPRRCDPNAAKRNADHCTPERSDRQVLGIPPDVGEWRSLGSILLDMLDAGELRRPR